MLRLAQRNVQVVFFAAVLALTAIVAAADHSADASFHERVTLGREAGLAAGTTLGIGAPPTFGTLTPPSDTEDCRLTIDGGSPQTAECRDRWIDFFDHYRIDVRGGVRYVLWFEYATDCAASRECDRFTKANIFRRDPADATQPVDAWFVYPGGAATAGAVSGVLRTYLAGTAKLEILEAGGGSFGSVPSFAGTGPNVLTPEQEGPFLEEFWGYVASDHPQHAPDLWGVDRFFFQPDQDRTLLIEVGGEFVEGDPETGYRIWLQRIDPLPSDVTVRERFSYPTTAEVGATFFREFDVRNTGSGSPATGLTAPLAPRGSCETPSPGRLRCTINTTGMAASPAPVQFAFGTANHGAHDESVADWPSFSVTLTERAITTRAQITGTAEGGAGLGVSLSVSATGGFALEFQKDATIVEASRAAAFGASVEFGVGAGVKLGVIEPRFSLSRVAVSGKLAIVRTLALKLPDLTDSQQRRALATWLLTAAFEPALEPNPLLDLVYTRLTGQSLQSNYAPFVSKDEVGVSATEGISASLGVFTAQRPDFDPFNFGLGVSGGAAATFAWQFNLITGQHTISYRVDLTAALTFKPTTGLPQFFIEDDSLFDLPNFGATGAAGMIVSMKFTGAPSPNSLDELAFEFVWGDTLDQQLENNSLTITFSGSKLRQVGGALWQSIVALVDPATVTIYTPALLFDALADAINQVEGDVILKTTRGTGFAPTFAVGVDVQVGIKADFSVSIGGEWLLTVTQETDHWIIQEGKLVKVSEFAFTPTEASEHTITEIIADALNDMLSQIDISAIASSLWEAGTEVVVSQVGALTTATVRVGEQVTEFIDPDGSIRAALELSIRVIGGILSGLLETQALRSAQLDPAFLQSEIAEFSPVGAESDQPFTLSLTYVDSFAGDPQALRLFRYDSDNVWRPIPTTIDAATRTATGETTRLGLYAVGWDVTPPTITGTQLTEGFLAIVSDPASGIDGTTITLLVDGEPTAAEYSVRLGKVQAVDELPAGAEVLFSIADGAGNQTVIQAVVAVAPRVVTLAPGWNLVGWSGATPIEEAIASVAADLTLLFTWDAAADQFLSFRPGQPAFLNTLAELNQGDGVWLLTANGGEWSQPPISGARNVQLLDGFNLVMWTGPDGTPVEEAVASLGSALESLFLWDAAAQAFTVFSPSQPAFLNSATNLPHGAGVWIRLSRSATWTQGAP